MQPTSHLKRQLRQDKVDRARQRHPIAKAFGGIELFDVVRERMKAGIRMQFPEADEEQVQNILEERQSILDRRRA